MLGIAGQMAGPIGLKLFVDTNDVLAYNNPRDVIG